MTEETLLPAIWFLLLGGLLTAYATLDGFNLGVGISLPFAARNEEQRGSLFGVIGPFWAGYEVWLVAAGGAMVAAFPRLYADSFSGFYLVLMVVLWLLIARGGSIEFRNTVDNPLWHNFWDVVFCASSTLLALFYGAAAGNVIRGVPLDALGNFQGSFALALNPYSIVVGLLAVVLLGMHGSAYTASRAEGEIQTNARRTALRMFPVVVVLAVAASIFSFVVRPDLGHNFVSYPGLILLPLCAFGGLVLSLLGFRREADDHAVKATSATIVFFLATVGASLFPRLLPATDNPANDLTIYNSAAPPHNLFTALLAYVLAVVLIVIYTAFVHRVFRGKFVESEGYH